MKFLCDDNLGRLARYLRVLGFDTAFYPVIDDASLLRIAAGEERFLITRDHRLAEKSVLYGILILDEDVPLKQLARIINELNLMIDTSALFARCSVCNTLCEPADKPTLSQKVFPFILKTQPQITHCPSCGRYYWKGTHYKVLLRKLKNLINDKNLLGKWPDDV